MLHVTHQSKKMLKITEQLDMRKKVKIFVSWLKNVRKEKKDWRATNSRKKNSLRARELEGGGEEKILEFVEQNDQKSNLIPVVVCV